ncbi:hypothetical protein IAQ61_002963 [Plenodomus lingam]|uniref:Similar to chitin binding protein n=1 Tax=Leptosphaeria maculans (strain JN3 / isolate v23.1.3 / race Av1-4-5-6-7-8) TaxID=985895 RepID=E5A859_LEPMJ|nr:similar to chitin binding protein [Plenodomus lingam JN3]KAH9877596.1 hypothetical protein IAQ61_002963 [Plenodomus lingam]CBX99804.1 similar to chitin binding protein [Plenodomus lingam JN3]
MHHTALAALAALTPLVHAHGVGLPKIVGLNPRDLKARELLGNLGARFAEPHEFLKAPEQKLQARQDDRRCGAGIGSCAAGECCSEGGYCGTDDDFCYSPGCNYAYGPGCPDNVTPSGTNTSSIARTKVGDVLYGGDGIYNCVKPGTVALTYDDGPQKVFTSHILDVLDSYGAKATFFVTGNNINKGQIDTTPEFVADIKRMDSEGHQIASHTWTHLDLSAVSQLDRKNQMWKNEMAIRNIIGKIPTYMRPPYSSCTGQCETDMADLGYHVIYFDVDTDDYNQDSPAQIQNSKHWFRGNITQNGAKPASSQWLEIGHDIHEQTAMNLTDYMLSTLTQLGYKGVTVGDCLGDPKANWYRVAGGAGSGTGTGTSNPPAGSSTPPRASTAPSSGNHKMTTDATCGGKNKYTCLGSSFGNCCSTNGYCGSTPAYCGTGCQPDFGNCGSNGSAPSKASPKPSPSPAATSPATGAAKVSKDGRCGGKGKFTCAKSSFGNCCSQYGYCGSTAAYCSAPAGCQAGFGSCTA